MHLKTALIFLVITILFVLLKMAALKNLVLFLVISPKVSNLTDDQHVPEGSNLTLFCGASGSPVPNITWTKVFENNSESEVLHRHPTWNIADIKRLDAGTYRCTANNGIGNPDSKTLNVDVLCKYMVSINLTL